VISLNTKSPNIQTILPAFIKEMVNAGINHGMADTRCLLFTSAQ